ncbi:MAG: Trk system potassium transporter TrkA [Alphaproteobacteria bacterium]|nr:Trk system potassium transporter TrkA [Alphaproteobacteria bacterium]
MKVVICGAGQVGTSIARHLAGENNDVTVIDQEPALIQKISDTLDVRAIQGFASHPGVLEQAGLRDAEMLIAVTYSDEVNMVACQVGHSLFNVPTKIARVRNQDYLQPIWADLFSREHMPIDVIISPEREVARAIGRRLQAPGALDVVPMADGMVRVVGVRCDETTPIIETPLRQLTSLFHDLAIVVVGILRNERAIVPKADDQMLPGDEVYFVCDSAHLTRALASFGHEEQEARSVVIAGGGNIGLTLAQEIEREHPGVNAKIIEYNRERARFIAQALNDTMVLNGDALDLDILEEANIAQTETFVAVSNDDEVNILSSLLAKRSGCQRTVTLINASTYASLITQLGIDTVVNPRAITVSSILQHVRRGRIRSVYSVREDFGEVIEAEALETSVLVGKPLKNAKLPDGVIVGAIVRGETVIMPRGDTVIEAKDRVVVFATYAAVKKVEKLFAVRLDFF